MPASTSRSNPFARVLSWVGLTFMVGMLWLGQSGSSEARIDPYYIVRGTSFGTITPRVLFVLDTSGSMNRRASTSAGRCRWSRCESPDYYNTTQESRMSAARRAVQQVVAGAGDAAQFSFMTFVQNGPETNDTPAFCNNWGEPTRFAFVEHSYDWGATNSEIRRQEPGPDNYRGGMRLCQGNARRPYAYIRWDELGNGSVIGSNNEAGDVPASPLISMAAGDYLTFTTLRRRVQFFPEFMGVRAQLNPTTDPGGDILARTVGDYDRNSEVWNNDFYYWPYVDGFPGYSAMIVGVEYADEPNVLYGYDGTDNAGIAGGNDWFAGVQLHAPFFVDLSDTTIPADRWGPESEAESLDVTLGRTAPLIEGGVDSVGTTPWSSAVGDIPASPPEDNRPGSHSSIASYLSFLSNVAESSACAPTSVVLMTDGEPFPAATEGGPDLYARLAALRNDLGASVYVVGFFLGTGGELNDMACAAAGACDGASCSSPCNDEPADGWDTCQDPDNPGTTCAYVASSTDELEAILASIIDDALQIEVESGPGAVVNDFGAEGLADGTDAVQTTFSASTDYPGWQGHVERRYCTATDEFGDLLASCEAPSPEFPADETVNTFGPCDRSRDWDAGECLQLTDWRERRLFSHDDDNVVFRISLPDGTAAPEFESELVSLGLIGGPNTDDQADEVVAFLLGRDAPGGWKLPGISNSAPITVRRVPEYNSLTLPEVPINDPHCAGRRFGDLDAGTLPDSLESFAQDAWSDGPDYAYQEAVVVGDDHGVIHAFQLDSGNELFGLIPRFALANAVEQAANGPVNMGQSTEEDLENHLFGMAGTLNHGWAYDSGDSQWRHVGVMGMGEGGRDLIALDFSHMNPAAGVPIEVLWTTEDTDGGRNVLYDNYLGETWARSAIAYHVEGDNIGVEPESFVVIGSGYAEEGGASVQGRTLVLADAITGDILERAAMPAPTNDVYESAFGAVVDPSVASHCLSRYWAEAQETYIADPAGRLFRWDLGRGTAPLDFKHDADSGGGPWGSTAEPVFTFPACTGTGTSCTVNPSNPGDPFLFSPSVTAFNRIDDVNSGGVADVEENNQFLVALVSGGPNEDTLDGGEEDNDFHSSLYLLVDDHSTPGDEGFIIPPGAPVSGGSFGAGDALAGNPTYLRMAVSDIERTRTVTPYPGATPFSETRTFSKAARPIRAPRIYVTGVVDDSSGEPVVIEDVEVYYVTYFIYEPGSGECDPRFYDEANDEWYADRGSTYHVTLRLTADGGSGFEFNNGSNGGDAPADFGGGFQTGLELSSVEQHGGGDCPSGNCGASAGTPSYSPCDNSGNEDVIAQPSYAIPLASKSVDAFTPTE
ncbi:MAG: type IV pilin biogenesis protein [Myxococcota bacterium]